MTTSSTEESSHEFAITERDLSFQIDHFEENTVIVPSFAVCTLVDKVIFVHFLTTISKI